MEAFDVVCVGCGPSGNIAAYLLARAGLRVALIEKESIPRVKVCGGGLTAKALAELPYDISEIVHHQMSGAYVQFAGGIPIYVSSEGVGAMVERSELDSFMTFRAVEAGVTLLSETVVESLHESSDGVSIKTNRGLIRGRLVIGADGAKSKIRSLCFPALQSAHAFGVEANLYWPSGSLLPEGASVNALFDFGVIDKGYGWIFPKKDHFNVGIYRIEKSATSVSLKRVMENFIEANPILKNCHSTDVIGHPIPLCTGSQPVGRGRIILIGDAAGLGEAFFGEGIAFALRSGTVAAKWAERALSKGGAIDGATFAEDISSISTELRYSLRMANTMYLVPPRLMGRLAGFVPIQRMIVRLLEGNASYRRSYWKLIALIPLALLFSDRVELSESPFSRALS